MITNNPDFSVQQAQSVCLGGNARLRTMGSYHALRNDLQMECFDVWNSNYTGEHYVTDNLPFSSEESTESQSYLGDLTTHLYTCVTKFIVGEMNFDSDYDRFQEELVEMGLDNLTKIQQSVYDRWAGLSE